MSNLMVYICITLSAATSVLGQQRSQVSRARNDCTADKLRRCMSLLSPVNEGNDSALPVNREELNQVCDDLRVGVKCSDKHARQCFTMEQSMVFDDLVNPSRQFINQLCEEGPIQAEFLQHAKCFKNISKDKEKCAEKYQIAVSTSSNATNAKDIEQSMMQSCCSLRAFVHCKLFHVSQDCGSKAEQFMKDHLGQMTNPIMEKHCAAYTYGSEGCLERSKAASHVNDSPNCGHRPLLDLVGFFALPLALPLILCTLHFAH